jgi:hypothetical protein
MAHPICRSRAGKKGPYAAYYIQLQPGASFVGKQSARFLEGIALRLKLGGGFWNPDGPALATIREDIDQHPHRLKRALMNETLRGTYFEKAKIDEKKVIAAFATTNAPGALKTKPKVCSLVLDQIYCSTTFTDGRFRGTTLTTRILLFSD